MQASSQVLASLALRPSIHQRTIFTNSRFHFDHWILVPGSLLGSCNGFLCHHEVHHLHISNPVTGEFLSLPTPSKPDTVGGRYGFGFSPTSDVYKLVRIMPIHKQVMVLTVGSGIWRDIGHPPDSFDGETLGKPCAYQNYFDSMNDHGTCVNGFLHWIGSEY
ncbi:hypothetical protein L3X38_003685 [Prunus dulcis]|uniref:F-box associated beta-propeller type 3 domain-containing protein n=1 Tax=Prunus dulcis TaxID=3755 RepID=A0AAD5F2E7_PRUDU|nr:hypothetical protein L3X38_003685 [Prunus dulcis]